VRLAQEAALGCVCAIVRLDAHLLAVLEPEGADVDGVGERVLAARIYPAVIADDIAAGVSAHVLGPRDAAAEHLHRERLDLVLHPQCERGGRFAGELGQPDVGSGDLGDGECVFPSAAVGPNVVGDRLCDDVGRAEYQSALVGVAPERCKPCVKEPGRRIFQGYGCKRRKTLRHQAEPENRKHGRQQQHCENGA